MFYHGIGKTTDFSIFVTICFQWFLYELNSIIFLSCEWYSNYPPAGNSSLLNVSPLVVWFHFCISLFERFTYFHKNLKKEMCLLSRPGEKRTLKNRLEKMIGFIFKFSVLYKNLNLPTSFCSCYLELKTIDVLCFEILLGKTSASTRKSGHNLF